MVELKEAMDRVKAEQQARAALLLAAPTDSVQDSVETTVTSDYGRYRCTEKWWKQGGVVFRQIDDSPIEATAFMDVPFVRITVTAPHD